MDVQILDSTGTPVGATTPAGCDPSGGSRTERVLLQGSSLVNGSYRVVLTGKTCGAGTPSTITTVAVVQTESAPKCPATFFNVPVGGSVTACSFTVP